MHRRRSKTANHKNKINRWQHVLLHGPSCLCAALTHTQISSRPRPHNVDLHSPHYPHVPHPFLLLSSCWISIQEADFQAIWKGMKTGKNRPLEDDEIDFLDSCVEKVWALSVHLR